SAVDATAALVVAARFAMVVLRALEARGPTAVLSPSRTTCQDGRGVSGDKFTQAELGPTARLDAERRFDGAATVGRRGGPARAAAETARAAVHRWYTRVGPVRPSKKRSAPKVVPRVDAVSPSLLEAFPAVAQVRLVLEKVTRLAR